MYEIHPNSKTQSSNPMYGVNAEETCFFISQVSIDEYVWYIEGFAANLFTQLCKVQESLVQNLPFQNIHKIKHN